MAACYIQTSSSSCSPASDANSPITELAFDEYSSRESMNVKRGKDAGFLDDSNLLQTLQVEHLSSRNTPSLAVTRSRTKSHDINTFSYHGIRSKNVSSPFTSSYPLHEDSASIMHTPIPPFQTLSYDWTDPGKRHQPSLTLKVPNGCSAHTYSHPKSERRNGFWKTVTRPTPGELSLKYRKKLNHGTDISKDSIYKHNDKDPDEIDTNFVLNLLQNKPSRKEDEDKPLHLQTDPQQKSLNSFLDDSFAQNISTTHAQRQRKHSYPFDTRKSVSDHMHRLNVLRSQENTRLNHDLSCDGDEIPKANRENEPESHSALERFKVRLNSRSSIAHRHNRAFCAECIPNVASSRLLGALDSYRRKDGIKKSNQSLTSNVNAAHAQTDRESKRNVRSKVKGRNSTKARRPEILVKFEDGPDYLKTIKIPDNVQLPSITHTRQPEALLKLTKRRETSSNHEDGVTQADVSNETLNDGSYPGYFTFSTTVRAVTTPANTPVSQLDRQLQDDRSPEKGGGASPVGKVVNVMTHGKGALIIQQHKDFKAAKLDVFLPQVKMGER